MSGLVGKRGVQLRIQTRSHAHAFFNSLALQQLFVVFFRCHYLSEAKLSIEAAPLIGGSGAHLVTFKVWSR